MRIVLLLPVFLLFVIPASAQDPAAEMRAAGCGADNIQFNVQTDKRQHAEPRPQPNEALIYVFEQVKLDRDELPVNLATIRFGLDGQWVGASHGNSYFSFAANPGDHALCASWQTSWLKIARLSPADLTSAASLTAEAGKVYYFEARVDERNHDSTRPGVKLEAIDPAAAKILIAASSRSDSHPKK